MTGTMNEVIQQAKALVAKGLTQKQIGERLGVSPSTVRRYLKCPSVGGVYQMIGRRPSTEGFRKIQEERTNRLLGSVQTEVQFSAALANRILQLDPPGEHLTNSYRFLRTLVDEGLLTQENVGRNGAAMYERVRIKPYRDPQAWPAPDLSWLEGEVPRRLGAPI